MAIFNWSTNPYFTTNANGYVSPHGSDTTGDGSPNNPYRTRQKAIDQGRNNLQVAPHVIRDTVSNSGTSIYYEPGCILDSFSAVTFNWGSSANSCKIITNKQLASGGSCRNSLIIGTTQGTLPIVKIEAI